MKYQIAFAPRAERQLKKLPNEVQRRLAPKIESLADNPRPAGVKKLEGQQTIYRLRVGDYRVIYEIRDAVLLVLVLAVGHRAQVYRR